MLFLGLKKRMWIIFQYLRNNLKISNTLTFLKKNPCQNFQKATSKIALFLSKMRYELCVMIRMMSKRKPFK